MWRASRPLIDLHIKGARIPSTLSLNDNEPVKTADLEAGVSSSLAENRQASEKISREAIGVLATPSF